MVDKELISAIRQVVSEEVSDLKQGQENLRVELGYTNKKLDKLENKVDHMEEQLNEFKEEVHGEFRVVHMKIDSAISEQNQMKKEMKEGFRELNMSIQAVHALTQMNQLQIQEHEEKYHKEGKLVNLG